MHTRKHAGFVYRACAYTHTHTPLSSSRRESVCIFCLPARNGSDSYFLLGFVRLRALRAFARLLTTTTAVFITRLHARVYTAHVHNGTLARTHMCAVVVCDAGKSVMHRNARPLRVRQRVPANGVECQRAATCVCLSACACVFGVRSVNGNGPCVCVLCAKCVGGRRRASD